MTTITHYRPDGSRDVQVLHADGSKRLHMYWDASKRPTGVWQWWDLYASTVETEFQEFVVSEFERVPAAARQGVAGLPESS